MGNHIPSVPSGSPSILNLLETHSAPPFGHGLGDRAFLLYQHHCSLAAVLLLSDSVPSGHLQSPPLHLCAGIQGLCFPALRFKAQKIGLKAFLQGSTHLPFPTKYHLLWVVEE